MTLLLYFCIMREVSLLFCNVSLCFKLWLFWHCVLTMFEHTLFHPCLFSALTPWIVVKTASIINDPINSLHWFLLSCQGDGEAAGGELRRCLCSAWSWISSLWASEPGADCWCSEFMAMMSFLLPEIHTAPCWGSVPSCGVPLLINLRRGAVCVSMLAPTQIQFDRHGGWAKWG